MILLYDGFKSSFPNQSWFNFFQNTLFFFDHFFANLVEKQLSDSQIGQTFVLAMSKLFWSNCLIQCDCFPKCVASFFHCNRNLHHKGHIFSSIQIISIHKNKQVNKWLPCFGFNCPDLFVSWRKWQRNNANKCCQHVQTLTQFCKGSRIIVPVRQTNDTPLADAKITN